MVRDIVLHCLLDFHFPKDQASLSLAQDQFLTLQICRIVPFAIQMTFSCLSSRQGQLNLHCVCWYGFEHLLIIAQ